MRDCFKKDVLVSIIVPTFDCEGVVVRALQSIKTQTFQDFEVIIVDDCSSDNTCEEIENFIVGMINYHLIQLPVNSGAGVARSTGLGVAIGKYIAFLDADDFWEPQKLELQVAYLENNSDVIIVHSGYNILSQDLNLLGVIKPINSVGFFMMHFSNFIATSTSLFRADLIGASSMPSIRARQDYAFWLKLLRANSGKVIGMPYILCNYVKMQGSLSSSKFKNIKYNFFMFKSVCDYPVIFSIFLVILNSSFRILKYLTLRFSKII